MSHLAGKRRPDSPEWTRFLWLQTGFLGDIILTTAALDWVNSNFPGVRQTLITTPLGAKALKDHPALDEILIFDKRRSSLWQCAKDLRKASSHYEKETTVLLQTHRSARSSLLAKALGFHTVTYQESKLSFLAHRCVPRVALLHESQRILLLLEALGIARWDFAEALPSLPPQEDSALGREISDWISGRPLLALAPGSVWGTKRWPQEQFQALARAILEKTEARILVLGTADEADAASCVAMVGEQFPDRIKNLAGKTQLEDLRAIYPQLRILVCNDSSPLHYASAFRVPSLAIFGATVPALGFGPLAPRSRVIESTQPCRPCSDHGPQTCPLTHFACMRQISHERVLTEVLSLLDDSPLDGASERNKGGIG